MDNKGREKRNLGRNKNRGERKEKIKEKGKIEKEKIREKKKIIKINTWCWRGLLNYFLLFLNDTVSHVSNFPLPRRQISNEDDAKSIIENKLKTQGLNWNFLKHKDQIENTP